MVNSFLQEELPDTLLKVMLRAGGASFFVRAEPERSEGGWSEAQPNREGVAAGGAT